MAGRRCEGCLPKVSDAGRQPYLKLVSARKRIGRAGATERSPRRPAATALDTLPHVADALNRTHSHASISWIRLAILFLRILFKNMSYLSEFVLMRKHKKLDLKFTFDLSVKNIYQGKNENPV